MTTNSDYNPNIPQRNDTIAKSQLDFLNNFSHLFQAFSNNHVDLNALSSAGNHTVIQLAEQNAQFQTDLGEISVYSKFVEGQTDQIFLKYQGSQEEFQFTNYQIYGLIPTMNQVNFFTFLPGKVILYFGFITTTLPSFLSQAGGAPLKLAPAIARNIITINLCPLGITPGYTPTVTLQQPINGIYSVLNMFNSIPQNLENARLYFCVMANI